MSNSLPGHEAGGRPATPRWVKVIGVAIAIVLLVALAVMVLGGGQHGPGMHTGAMGILAATL